ncbi:TPA: lpg1148 family Dot/Icm T4SS effector, partial [Legionella pneumophila]|nr:lpg1148 family Dot/Icm T4SS effector [Legionella pneumophila]HAU3914566.1 lpg1148 family Dot/Icm T4SS effector [Legionella pneumophila]HAU3920990.1 lpg1148 family Dot/Icm T4SS effector [Legionella pneumophila]
MYMDFGSDNMALSKEIQNKSLRSLIQKYARQLNETDKKLIELINNLAAADDIPLYAQNQNVINLLIKTIKDSQSEHSPDLEGTSYFIYGLITAEMEAQSEINRQRHLMQGRFDETALYLRTERDQMQDHDMTLLMPKSQGRIVVMAVLNRYDTHSANAIIEALASDVFNPEVHHIMIPVGPGHWRGVYLSKPQGGIS